MELNVISYNILCCDAANGNSIVQRAPRLQAVITPLDADLIGFQEVTPVWLEILHRDYGKEYEIYNVYRGQNNHESTPIAWKRDKFVLLDKGTLWFSDTPEIESRGWDNRFPCPRIFTWVHLKEHRTGTEFCFLNTHFGFGDECQTKSAQMLISFTERMDCPCIITGDFNMELNSAGYGIMSKVFRDVNADTVNDTSPTFHGFDPEHIGEHIDYCFVTKNVRPRSYQCIRKLPDGMHPSDHYGLFASLSL